MDPTTALDHIRDILRRHRQGDPVDMADLVELWEWLHRHLLTGGDLPEQWTGAAAPSETDATMHHGLAVPVTDPTATVAEMTRHYYPQDLDRFAALLAGLDRWITVESSILPDQWLTTRK